MIYFSKEKKLPMRENIISLNNKHGYFYIDLGTYLDILSLDTVSFMEQFQDKRYKRIRSALNYFDKIGSGDEFLPFPINKLLPLMAFVKDTNYKSRDITYVVRALDGFNKIGYRRLYRDFADIEMDIMDADLVSEFIYEEGSLMSASYEFNFMSYEEFLQMSTRPINNVYQIVAQPMAGVTTQPVTTQTEDIVKEADVKAEQPKEEPKEDTPANSGFSGAMSDAEVLAMLGMEDDYINDTYSYIKTLLDIFDLCKEAGEDMKQYLRDKYGHYENDLTQEIQQQIESDARAQYSGFFKMSSAEYKKSKMESGAKGSAPAIEPTFIVKPPEDRPVATINVPRPEATEDNWGGLF